MKYRRRVQRVLLTARTRLTHLERDADVISEESKNMRVSKKTYNRRYSLVVTHPTTNRPACGLSTAERTGSPVFHTLWSYVKG